MARPPSRARACLPSESGPKPLPHTLGSQAEVMAPAAALRLTVRNPLRGDEYGADNKTQVTLSAVLSPRGAYSLSRHPWARNP